MAFVGEIFTGKRTTTYAPVVLYVGGGAGCGKTFVLKLLREMIERMTATAGSGVRPHVHVYAPNGFAASHVAGAGTYHTMLGPSGPIWH